MKKFETYSLDVPEGIIPHQILYLQMEGEAQPSKYKGETKYKGISVAWTKITEFIHDLKPGVNVTHALRNAMEASLRLTSGIEFRTISRDLDILVSPQVKARVKREPFAPPGEALKLWNKINNFPEVFTEASIGLALDELDEQDLAWLADLNYVSETDMGTLVTNLETAEAELVFEDVSHADLVAYAAFLDDLDEDNYTVESYENVTDELTNHEATIETDPENQGIVNAAYADLWEAWYGLEVRFPGYVPPAS